MTPFRITWSGGQRSGTSISHWRGKRMRVESSSSAAHSTIRWTVRSCSFRGTRRRRLKHSRDGIRTSATAWSPDGACALEDSGWRRPPRRR
jgi:hypothetical protein